MRLVTYLSGERVSIGKLVDDQIIDIPGSDPSLPSTMLDLLAAGEDAMDRVRSLGDDRAAKVPLATVRLLPPIPNPGKFLAIGMNYAKHVQESIELGFKMPTTQVWFNKQVSCVNGPYDPVVMPRVSDQLDYEVELAFVIGKRCRHVKASDARSMIAGYMICNDVSVRDWQMASPTMTLGKSFDTHGPIGPWLVTEDEITDPHSLNLRLSVNGDVRQDDNTSNMVANIFSQLAHLSTVFTLEPGDIIATGTPSGVAVAMKPPRYLKVGDVVRAEIERIGYIENVVVAEPV